MGFLGLCHKKASKDKKEEDFLKSLLEQAKHFYITAETSPIKSQSLLFYYSFLNLSKIVINLDVKHGSRKLYMHGITENHNNKFSHSTITKQVKKTNIVQVAHEIVSIFDENIPALSIQLNVRDLLNHCVGVHRSYSEIYSAVGCNEIAPLIWRPIPRAKAALQTVQCAALIAPYVFR
ncbi:hypothetical protein CJP16_09540 [Aeromonas sobria]|uniref:Uncharacterized protein n=1 Tax=Aeromonas sobria TaxID=646 RepID=A0A2N3IZZ2_AERSO|nr:YaaC family protein [Aeromonas sobria]PKQ78779.1 hypothetical protein CJP16_09540 [Aeromonas sobria]